MPTYVFIPENSSILTNELLNYTENHHILHNKVAGIAIDYTICPDNLRYYEQFSCNDIKSLYLCTVQHNINGKMTNIHMTAQEFNDNLKSTPTRYVRCMDTTKEILDIFYDFATDCLYSIIDGFRE